MKFQALAPLLTSGGFPAHFIVEQARSGVQDIRAAWGDWCNVKGAGFGIRPTTNTGSSLIDSIVWVKPGGESDGTTNQSSPRYDYHCTLVQLSPSIHSVAVTLIHRLFSLTLLSPRPRQERGSRTTLSLSSPQPTLLCNF